MAPVHSAARRAVRAAACPRPGRRTRRACQPGPGRRGAGSMPAACKISHTVDGAIVTPSFMSSPWIRRCPHSGFSFARRTTRRAMPATTGGRPGLRRLLVSYFFATSLRCQASSVAGVTGKTSAQRLRGTSRARDEPGPVSRLIPYPAGLPPQDHVLVPEHQQFSILRQVTAAHQDGQAEHPARKQVHDLEQHPPTQPSPRLACWRTRRSAMQSSIRAAQGSRIAPTAFAGLRARLTFIAWRASVPYQP